MIIDRSGIPFVGVPVAAAVLCGWLWGTRAAAPPLALAAGLCYFFRDPERIVPDGSEGVVVAPADGRILVAGEATAGIAPPGVWQQISIFLSPVDVHVNRIPLSGEVVRVEHRPGRFLPAYRREAATDNERTETWIRTTEHMVVMRQVVGVLARRIVCRLRPGQQVVIGERFGIMKFGSRMDVFLPLEATVRVAVGDRVRRGETVLAHF